MTFLGPIPAVEIPEFMCSLDVFVSPSLEESFGMTLIEAIMQGTPVVGGSASGAVPWVLNFGEAGELVNVQDPASIAWGITRSLDVDESTRKARYDYVHENFSLGHVVDRYEAKYCSVLAAWKRPARRD